MTAPENRCGRESMSTPANVYSDDSPPRLPEFVIPGDGGGGQHGPTISLADGLPASSLRQPDFKSRGFLSSFSL